MRGDESFSCAAIIDLTNDASRAGVTAGDGAHKLQRTSGAPPAGYADARRLGTAAARIAPLSDMSAAMTAAAMTTMAR